MVELKNEKKMTLMGDHLPESFFDRTPKCLAKFKTSRVSVVLPATQDEASNSVTKSICCICGNEKLYLEAAQHKEVKGVCKVMEFITFDPPVYVVCPACKRYALLFDPLIYGRKSESGESGDSPGDFKLTRCTPKPGKVWVNYSYKNLKDGVENPEDYFDSFAVFYSSDSTENIREIVSVACG